MPDSLLRDVCAFITSTVPPDQHVIAANEGTALALAAGHYLATSKVPCVYLQNSGLGNTVNPLVSLCNPKVYSIPVLLMIGWRGEPGKKDEPQHLTQGAITPTLLKEMKVPYEILPDYAEGAFDVLQIAYDTMKKTNGPFALLVKKQTFASYNLDADVPTFQSPGLLHREEILQIVTDVFPSDPIVTTTGFTSREMFELRSANKQSHENDFLTVGSMGHCSSLAMGIALAQKDRQVLCVDGDGAAIMHMGAFATAGTLGTKHLPNFKHILINNAVHDSVGGQPSGAATIDFVAIARASGYQSTRIVSVGEEIKAALQQLKDEPGPAFLEIRALPGARADLGRPTTSTTENKEAFMRRLLRP